MRRCHIGHLGLQTRRGCLVSLRSLSQLRSMSLRRLGQFGFHCCCGFLSPLLCCQSARNLSLQSLLQRSQLLLQISLNAACLPRCCLDLCTSFTQSGGMGRLLLLYRGRMRRCHIGHLGLQLLNSCGRGVALLLGCPQTLRMRGRFRHGLLKLIIVLLSLIAKRSFVRFALRRQLARATLLQVRQSTEVCIGLLPCSRQSLVLGLSRCVLVGAIAKHGV